MEHKNTYSSGDGIIVEMGIRTEHLDPEEKKKVLSFIAQSSHKFYLEVAEEIIDQTSKTNIVIDEKELDIDESKIKEAEGKLLWGMQRHPGEEGISIFPMSGTGKITIHGEREAMFFTKCLLDHFQKG